MQARAYVHTRAFQDLLSAHEYLKAKGYGLKLFDAYRPLYVSKAIYMKTPGTSHRCTRHKYIYTHTSTKASKFTSSCLDGVFVYTRCRKRVWIDFNFIFCCCCWFTEQYRGIYVANPNSGSNHNRGLAVDVGLVYPREADGQGADVEQPSKFDCFSSRAHTTNARHSDKARRYISVLTEVVKNRIKLY